MSRLSGPATRLTVGSRLTLRRLGSTAARWVSRARRDDLTGWKAVLGCWLRLGLLVVGGWLLWRLVRAVPGLMWVLTGAWIVAAWRAGKPAPTEAEEEPPAEAPYDPLPGILWDLIGEAPGVHVKTLAAHLTAAAPDTPVDRPAVRAALTARGIPVRGSVRDASGKVNEGVHRADLEGWEQAFPDPSSGPHPGARSNPVATPLTSDVAETATAVATPPTPAN